MVLHRLFKLLQTLDPRLVITGHTHNFCLHHHLHGHSRVPEWTIPSFSWRNKNNPSFLLVSIHEAWLNIDQHKIILYIDIISNTATPQYNKHITRYHNNIHSCCCYRPTPPACSCGGVRQPSFSREALPGVSST